MISKDELFNLYVEKNMTQTEIGNLYGCDRKNVDYYLKKYNIPKRTRKETMTRLKRTTLSASDIDAMIKNGMLIQDICEKYNVHRSTIYKITKEAGLNYQNHEGQTRLQSSFMEINNPFRDEDVKNKAMENSRKRRKELFYSNLEKFDEDMTFKRYAKIARYVAYYHYGRGSKIPKGLVIDHVYSVKDAYANKIPLSVLSHPFNLRLIPREDNLKKAYRSHITIEELFAGVGVQRLSYTE